MPKVKLTLDGLSFLEADPELVYQLTLIAQRLGSIDNALRSASLG